MAQVGLPQSTHKTCQYGDSRFYGNDDKTVILGDCRMLRER